MGEAAKKIMIVDDEPDILELLDDILSMDGYEVINASNGFDALEKLKANSDVELIISDIRMPVMGGVDLLKNVKKQNPFSPAILFVSGFGDITVEESLALGACTVLAKPFEWDDLSEAVTENLVGPPKFQRKFQRADVKLDIKYSLNAFKNDVHEGKTFNIGQGGMFLAGDQEISIKDLVNFELTFSDGDINSFTGVGKVVWVRQTGLDDFPNGFGIKFLELNSELETYISKFIKEHNTVAFIPRK